jgi:tetratricopeptide (TPR) repeat protein
MPDASGNASQRGAAELLSRARHALDGNRRAEAARLCQRVWAAKPEQIDILCQLGALYNQLGDLQAALLCYQRAEAIQTAVPAVQFGLGTALDALGRKPEALDYYDRAIALRPDYLEALNNRGIVLHALGRHDDALRSYDRALTLQPEYVIAIYNRGNLHRHTNRPAEALADYDRALVLRPNFMEAMNNRGVALQLLSRHAEALEAHDRALTLRPNDADALNNRASALLILNRHAEAQACYDRALTAQPNWADAHFNSACCRLALGDFSRGWAEFEWRLKMPSSEIARRDMPQKPWRGGAVRPGKTILLWGEQGFGDTLQFCRYVPLVASRANIVLQVPQPLLRLLCSLPGGGQITAQEQPPSRFDLHCPLMSLPYALGTTLTTIPNRVPYLEANPADVATWRGRLAGLTGLRVGIVWAGNPRASEPMLRSVDHRRSCGLEHLLPLALVDGVDLVSLQKDAAAAQARTPPDGMVIHDWTDRLRDFADTAALIETLDLVISVDTAVAHLAGALGKQVWVLSRFDACWRWLIDREDSPWYLTARIFRQPRPGDWASVVGRVAGELRKMVSGRTGRRGSKLGRG